MSKVYVWVEIKSEKKIKEDLGHGQRELHMEKEKEKDDHRSYIDLCWSRRNENIREKMTVETQQPQLSPIATKCTATHKACFSWVWVP